MDLSTTVTLLLQVPSGESLTFGDDNFIHFEEIGVKEMQNAAFVLVAGGLGERLGYNGIKVNKVSTFLRFCSLLEDNRACCKLLQFLSLIPALRLI